MTPTPFKATFLRSRSQLLDAALMHLSENYYPRLSQGEYCYRRKYLSTRNGTLLEGAIAFSQDNRNVLVSVTPFDITHFKNKLSSMNPSKIYIPQPDQGDVLKESIIAFLVLLIGMTAHGPIEAGIPISCFLACIYYVFKVIYTEDLGRKLRQAPSVSLAFIVPNCQLPANENWLVVGDEIFTQDDGIESMALLNLCNKSGTGLLVFNQNDIPRIWIHPKHDRTSFETKYNASYGQLMSESH